ncbi:hypothetical protein C1T31_08005 [Hanstruepera neustonica]|uniref:Lipocalin-like domain-containing protein n=1 Tax=Hanstruepera neustonica TaxID=1445657 RepID=A0A2K1DZH7_9FLAO|nr:hypothetical protein [Hanstruepera neustonica]PNQ73442.1 hypothetical protein C1T31_08005 [Hanstruepera neustonica]
MNFSRLIILLILLKSFNLSAQKKLEIGQHVYKDKLTYISLSSNNEFEYLKYYNWSPLTIEEKQIEEKDKNETCGTIGYVSGAKGKGKYEIKNGKLILRFSEFDRYMDNKTDYNEETKTMEFVVSEFIR